MSTNLALEYLRTHGETLADYEGVCGELASAIMRDVDHSLWVEGDIPWKYHMVLLRDGLVHDAWCDAGALPPREWLVHMFGATAEVEVSLDGDDPPMFVGRCQDFPDAIACQDFPEVI